MAFATLRTRHVDGLLLPLKKFSIISNCNSNYFFRYDNSYGDHIWNRTKAVFILLYINSINLIK